MTMSHWPTRSGAFMGLWRIPPVKTWEFPRLDESLVCDRNRVLLIGARR
jgi:hypothetical protein